MFDREKIFRAKRVTPPASSGFRSMAKAGGRASRRPGSVAAIASLLFALAGLRYLIHNLHHPDVPSHLATPLLAIAIMLGAWNRYSGKRL